MMAEMARGRCITMSLDRFVRKFASLAVSTLPICGNQQPCVNCMIRLISSTMQGKVDNNTMKEKMQFFNIDLKVQLACAWFMDRSSIGRCVSFNMRETGLQPEQL